VGVVYTHATRADGMPLAVIAARAPIGNAATRAPRPARAWCAGRRGRRPRGDAAVRSVIEQLRRELRDAA